MRLIDADAYAYPGDLVNEPTIEVTPKWISADERLPERDEQVLCRYIFGEHNDIPFYQVLDYYAFDPHPHFQHEGTSGMCITHWMPLPEPPKGV